MTEQELLLEGWRFDLWANEIWLAAAQDMPQPARPLEILGHVAWAQENWLGRVDPRFSPAQAPLSVRFKQLNSHWVELTKSRDLCEVVGYRNLAGETYNNEFGAICRHVIDHGTYHRGHLRGIAEMQGWQDFPETGLIGLFRTFQLH